MWWNHVIQFLSLDFFFIFLKLVFVQKCFPNCRRIAGILCFLISFKKMCHSEIDCVKSYWDIFKHSVKKLFLFWKCEWWKNYCSLFFICPLFSDSCKRSVKNLFLFWEYEWRKILFFFNICPLFSDSCKRSVKNLFCFGNVNGEKSFFSFNICPLFSDSCKRSVKNVFFWKFEIFMKFWIFSQILFFL